MHEKHQNARQTTFTLLEVFARKNMLPLLFSVCLHFFVGWFLLVSVFERSKTFRKINKQLEIVLITSLYYYTTDMNTYIFFGSLQSRATCWHAWMIFFKLFIRYKMFFKLFIRLHKKWIEYNSKEERFSNF